MTNAKTEIKTYKIGADGGNSKLKIVYDGKYTYYDNIYAPNCEIDYKAIKFTADEMDEYLRNVLNVRFTWHNNKKDKMVQDFLFGNITSANKKQIQERVNADKSDDIMLVMCTLLCSVNFIIENMDENEIEEEMVINLDLSTGLPYHEFVIPELRQKYAEHYEGEHIIEFKDPRYPVNKITLNVLDGVKVESEGVCGLKTIIEMQDIINEQTEAEYEETLWSLIDIGGFTTDIMGGIFEKKKRGLVLQTYDTLGKGINVGVSSAQDAAIEKINSIYKKKLATFSITRSEVNEAELREGKFNGVINKYKLNTLDYTTEEYQKLGRSIGNYYIQLYIENGRLLELEHIYIAGGGALNDILVESLIGELVKRGISEDIIEVITEPNPIYLNAVGYYLA